MSYADSNTFTISPPSVSVPAWAATPFEGFWKTISNNTLDDIDPDPSGSQGYTGTVGWAALTDSWAGAFIIPGYGDSGVLGCFNGGHVDNYWNGLVTFDLATGLWSIFKDTYASASGGTATNGIWPDGSPAVVHTYQGIAGLPWANKFIVAYRQITDLPSLTDSPSIFDFDTSTWDNRGEYPGSGFVTFDSSMMAVDINRQGVWMRGGITGAAFAFYDIGADDWTQYADQNSEDDSSMCHDPDLDILVMVQIVGGQLLQGISCSSPNTARVSLTQSGRPSLPEAPGVVYSQLRQAFIVWGTGENIYEVKKGSGTWDVATWTWTNLVDGANTVSPTANSTGCYSKLQIITYGTREFIVHCQQTNGPVYSFEIPQP